MTGKQFVRYWLHCAHLLVDGQKMSKSLGNFYTLRDVLEKGYTGREVRYALLRVHYRAQLNFTWEGMEEARQSLRRESMIGCGDCETMRGGKLEAKSPEGSSSTINLRSAR